MIKRIQVRDLEPGMFICDMNTPWIRHPYVPNRVLLRQAKDIDLMLRAGMDLVYIDTARGADSPKALPLVEAERETDEGILRDVVAAPEPDPEPPQRVPFEKEFRRARELYGGAKEEVKRQFDDATRGRPPDGETAGSSVADIISSIFRNRDAYLSLARLKSFDEYTFHHSLNVAVLSLNLAVSLGILDRELLRLGIGALLHDLGKVLVPGGLIQKQGRLDPGEYEAVKTHSLHGAKLILDSRTVPPECAAVPLGHHERFDGSGYPRSVSGARVGKFGLITAIADVYDAMTSTRPYQAGMAPTQALRRLYGWAGTHFHPVYVQRFIRCVGVYPIGSLVSLDTGQAGVVVRQNRGDLLRPWVRLVRDARGAPLWRGSDVDLREPDPAGERPFGRSIDRILDPAAERVNVDAILAGSPHHAA
jgi:putative nucleotidyltransferase with HDIG domain